MTSVEPVARRDALLALARDAARQPPSRDVVVAAALAVGCTDTDADALARVLTAAAAGAGTDRAALAAAFERVALAMLPPAWPCDCCGRFALARAPSGRTDQLCPLCGWVDDPLAPWSRRHRLDLETAQRRTVTHGSVAEDFDARARPPRADETRSPAARWRWDERALLLDAVSRAFALVERGSTTLFDAEVSDSHGLEPDVPRDAPERWQDLTTAYFGRFAFGGAPVFLDPGSLRFYLPAVMTLWLRSEGRLLAHPPEERFDRIGRDEAVTAIHLDVWLSALTWEHEKVDRFWRLLDPHQLDVVRTWLRYVAGPGFFRHEQALDALDRSERPR